MNVYEQSKQHLAVIEGVEHPGAFLMSAAELKELVDEISASRAISAAGGLEKFILDLLTDLEVVAKAAGLAVSDRQGQAEVLSRIAALKADRDATAAACGHLQHKASQAAQLATEAMDGLRLVSAALEMPETPGWGRNVCPGDMVAKIEALRDERRQIEADLMAARQSPGLLKAYGDGFDQIARISNALNITRPMGTLAECGDHIVSEIGKQRLDVEKTERLIRASEKLREVATARREAQTADAARFLKDSLLRTLVLRRAPHGHDCKPTAGEPCSCWKGEYLAATA